MSIHRVFLNWNRAGLVAAVEYLVERFGAPGQLDLSGAVLVTPGGRSGRRLLEVLVQQADEQQRVLTPPRIVTAGRLPELLYEARRPFADDLSQQLAWVAALKGGKPEDLQRLMPAPPPADDLAAWLALAEMLARLHRELAADALDFSNVADCGSRIEGFREQLRWQALAALEQEYLRGLDRLDLWDLQTARLYAIRQGECRTQDQIVLVGTVDLNRSGRMMLDQVAERVTALVLAPPELADRFDEHGCLRPEAWLEAPISLATDQIEIVDDPADQAEAVVRAIAAMGGRYRAEQISIGVPDEGLVPYVQQHLKQCEVPARYGAGRPLASSLPSRLLAAAADYLAAPRFAAFAALARHPAVQSWLESKGLEKGWLAQLDEYYAEHLPYALADEWLGPGAHCRAVRQAGDQLRRLLRDLSGPARPLGQWGEPIAALLVAVFGLSALDSSVEADRVLLAACKKIHGALREQASIPAALTPSVSGAAAIRLLLGQLAGETIAPLPDRDAVELLGWLELPLDDAPALVVTSLNEGWVPGSLNGDLFLPNQLRRALGIEDNDRRYARDAYALALLAASREFLRVIAGRRSADGDPQMPSRLLFACDEETIAHRVMAFCGTEPSPRIASAGSELRPGQLQSRFEVPKPRPLPEPINSMRVTEFKDYLACPYRYYLRHRLKLGALQDSAEELDGAAFGTLVHQVLGEFGKGPVAASTDAEQIERYLSDELDRQCAECFGKAPLSAIRVQVEQLRLRLREFARWQAAWAGQGWQIRCVEASPQEGKALLVVDSQPMFLRGRIDRIDFQPSTGKWMIIDYKSSDAPSTPEKAHRRGQQWIDLQLPLYRHLAAGLEKSLPSPSGRGAGGEGAQSDSRLSRTFSSTGSPHPNPLPEGEGTEPGLLGQPPGLAYVVLPKDISRTGIAIAEWTEEDLRSADRAAAEVIRDVRAEKFWPPAQLPPDFSEDLAPICQDGQFRAVFAAETAEGGIES
jgi:RecB family exonuclease